MELVRPWGPPPGQAPPGQAVREKEILLLKAVISSWKRLAK